MTTLQMDQCRQWIDRLGAAAKKSRRPLAFMEVCGTHTMTAYRCGLHSILPENVRMISGPGCPVCVTSQGDIDQLVDLARRPDITLCTYGDMLRVTGSNGSLEKARTQGEDVRVIYSSLDAVRIAASNERRQVVLSAVGFETTTPASAVVVLEAERLGLRNLTLLTSHKRIMPAMTALLESGTVKVDGFLCPGHVSVIIGAMPFNRIALRWRLPCAVVGFEDWQMVQGLCVLTEMAAKRKPALVNLYPEAVTLWGNRRAANLIRRVFVPCDATWRGLDVIPRSGLALRSHYRMFDARVRFRLTVQETPEPKGCICGDVITGRAVPSDCKLFGVVCTPVHPLGPCMVSSEGTCQAWFKYTQRNRRKRKLQVTA